MSDTVTNKDLYEAINTSTKDMRAEFTKAVQRLEDGVLANQTARINGLEARMNQIESDVKIDKTKLAWIVGIIVFCVNALVVVALRVIWPANK